MACSATRPARRRRKGTSCSTARRPSSAGSSWAGSEPRRLRDARADGHAGARGYVAWRRYEAWRGGRRVSTSATRLKRARRARTRAQPLTRRSGRGPAPKRVAIVTGAARGIGAATVQELVRDGWAVVAVDPAGGDRRLPYPLATEEELGALARDRVEVLAGDVASEMVLRDAVAVAEERFQGLDAFIATAGVIAGGVPLW